MDRKELLNFHEHVCSDARKLMNLKNRDYAGNEGKEPFANFTRCEAMGICETEAGFMVRVTDKMSRLSSFLRAGKMHVEDESFYDTIVDVINYMVLLGAYVKDKDIAVVPVKPKEFTASLNFNNDKKEEDLAPNEILYLGDDPPLMHHSV